MTNNTILASETTTKQDGTRDTRDTNLGVFPIEALPSTMSRYIREASSSLVCPPEMVALPLLITMASAIGTSRVIRLKGDWKEGTTIYGVVIAPPGSKKSPAANTAMKPMYEAQSKLQQEHRQLCGECEEDDETPSLERLYVDDTTIEALTVVLDQNRHGVMMAKDELTSWVRQMDQYKGKGSDRQFWLSAWSNQPYTVDRKSMEHAIVLERPYVSVYGTIQPYILSELSNGREDGMLDRFLFAYPEPMIDEWSDDEISEEAAEDLNALYLQLRELEGNQVGIRFEAEARAKFVELYQDHQQEKCSIDFPNTLREPWSKLTAYFARLTLILSTMRSVEEGTEERIEVRDVLAAHVLLDYFKSQTRKVYEELHEENEDEKFLADVVGFVRKMGGYVKDKPKSLYEAIQWSKKGKPARSDELTKKLKRLAQHIPNLTVNDEKSNGVRWLEITIDNGVPGDPGRPSLR